MLFQIMTRQAVSSETNFALPKSAIIPLPFGIPPLLVSMIENADNAYRANFSSVLSCLSSKPEGNDFEIIFLISIKRVK